MNDIAGLLERARASVEAGKADATKSAAHERYELERVAQQFEAMLLTNMLREMRKAGEVGKDDGDEPGLGLGTESFTETIDTELALYLSKNKGIGLTSQLMQAFDRMNAGRMLSATGAESRVPDPAPAREIVDRVQAPTSADSAVDAEKPTRETGSSPYPSSDNPAAAPDLASAQVTSQFGWRADPFTGQARFHRGIDLRAAYGEEVQAAAPGTVVFSGPQGSYGTTVVVEHPDGTRSRYAHLSAATADVGSPVRAGQPIGRAGSSGRATGPHLHFEVTGPAGEAIPPGQWMQRWAAWSRS